MRTAFVVVAFLVMGVVYLSLHIFPLEPFAVVFWIGLVYLAGHVAGPFPFPARPAASCRSLEAGHVPSACVFVRFIDAADVVVGLSSFGPLGHRRADGHLPDHEFGSGETGVGRLSAFFHSVDCVMWQGNADGRDCIVVSGPTYLRSKVEFALSTEGGG